MSPKDRTVIRAIVKALRRGDANDMQALSASYGIRRRLNNIAGRVDQSADLLEALITKESK